MFDKNDNLLRTEMVQAIDTWSAAKYIFKLIRVNRTHGKIIDGVLTYRKPDGETAVITPME